MSNGAVILGASSYNLTYAQTSATCTNFTTGQIERILTVNQNATNLVDIFFTNSTGTYKNQNITTPSGSSTTVNATAVYQNSGTTALYLGGNIASNPITIYLTLGMHNFTGNITGNANYTSNSTGATYYVDVIEVVPQNLTVAIDSPTNTTYTSTNQILHKAILNKEGSWCGVSINGTANQTMTYSGIYSWSLLTTLGNSTYQDVFCCNDTSGNMDCTANIYYTVSYSIYISPYPTNKYCVDLDKDVQYCMTSTQNFLIIGGIIINVS
jgi:hypothetical protein